jgi:hypothetical protein
VLGSKNDKLKFTKSFDLVNHVATENETDTIVGDNNTLDTILLKEPSPMLLKINL